MPSFDTTFSELQSKISAVISMLVNEFPEAAVRARQVIDGAVADAEVQETVQADEARANALVNLISGAREMLSSTATSEEQ